jgi:FtsP/CotA-like multicopper oxidase with cupredoxin domain
MEGMDMAQMMKDMPDMDMSSGWAKTGAPVGGKVLSYADLRYGGSQKDTRQPSRTITVALGGNMQRYIWTINGKKFMDADPIHLKYGERVRLKFVNETMMAHPMHLHGMFVQLENGQPMAKLPNKHTVIVPPAQTVSVLLTANETGEWAFHCHLQYHMLAGMMTSVVVHKPGDDDIPTAPVAVSSEGGHHHAH